MFLSFYFALFLFSAAFCDSTNSSNEDQLLSVVVIFRHGDRAPIRPYPNDPYKNESFWPVGWGQLTNLGKYQHYLLGRWLRDRYQTFLSEFYSAKDIYVRSTDVDRTLMSAEANLAGLFTPKGRQIWNAALMWQPIPIHTVPEKQDAVLATKKPCARYQKLQKDLYNTPFFRNITAQYHDLFAYLTRYSGRFVKDLEDFESLYNTFFIERLYNLTLPPWAQRVYPSKMEYLAGLSFTTMCYTEQMARLKIGLLISEITEHLSNATRHNTEDNPVKFRIYSAHDITIANVLVALGVFDNHCPPYTSTIIFELRKNPQSEHYLNIFYRNSSQVQNVTLNGCDFDCNFEAFQTIVKPLLITQEEWTEECELGLADYLHIDIMYLLLICIMITAFLVIIFGILCAIKCYRPYEEETIYTQLPNDEVA